MEVPPAIPKRARDPRRFNRHCSVAAVRYRELSCQMFRHWRQDGGELRPNAMLAVNLRHHLIMNQSTLARA